MALITRTAPEHKGGYSVFRPNHSIPMQLSQKGRWASAHVAHQHLHTGGSRPTPWLCLPGSLHSRVEQMLPISYRTVRYGIIPYRTGNTRSSVTNLFDLISGPATPYSIHYHHNSILVSCLWLYSITNGTPITSSAFSLYVCADNSAENTPTALSVLLTSQYVLRYHHRSS